MSIFLNDSVCRLTTRFTRCINTTVWRSPNYGLILYIHVQSTFNMYLAINKSAHNDIKRNSWQIPSTRRACHLYFHFKIKCMYNRKRCKFHYVYDYSCEYESQCNYAQCTLPCAVYLSMNVNYDVFRFAMMRWHYIHFIVKILSR
jgi:hypothetical protein